MTDPDSYCPAERQKTDDGYRYVRLSEEPMNMTEVLPWLEEQGLVKRLEDRRQESDTGYWLQGWGTTYFAVPWSKAVAR